MEIWFAKCYLKLNNPGALREKKKKPEMVVAGGVFSSSTSADQSACGIELSAFVRRLAPYCVSGLGKILAVQGDLLWCHWLSRREGFQRNLGWSHICSSSTRRPSCRPGGNTIQTVLKKQVMKSLSMEKAIRESLNNKHGMS